MVGEWRGAERDDEGRRVSERETLAVLRGLCDGLGKECRYLKQSELEAQSKTEMDRLRGRITEDLSLEVQPASLQARPRICRRKVKPSKGHEAVISFQFLGIFPAFAGLFVRLARY